MGRPRDLQSTLPILARMLRRFSPYLRRHRALLAGSFSCLCLEVVFRVLEPWPLKFIFDHLLNSETSTGLLNPHWAETLGPRMFLLVCVLGLVAAVGLRSLATYWSTIGFSLVGQRVLTGVRYELYRHLQYLPLSFHARSKSGDLVVRVVSDIELLRDVVVTALLPLAGKILILVVMLGLMVWFSPYLTFLALLPLPLFWLRTVQLSRRIHDVSRKQRRRNGALAATASESMTAIRTVQALSLEDRFAEAFVSQNQRSLKEGVKAKRLSARLETTTQVIIAISSALVLFFGAERVMGGELSPGDLLVFMFYLKNAFRPAQDFAKYTGRLAKAAAAGERILDVFEKAPEIRDVPGAVPAPPFEGRVAFENVTFGYTDNEPILKNIQLEAASGERVALVGVSGAGKSTLVSLILRLYEPNLGRVTIDGRDVRDFTIESLRAQVSVVLQDNLLFAGTIRENIALGKLEASDEEIHEAAALARASDFIEALPRGYDTPVGERGVTLSQGERQRIAIARAAIRRAPILILDEPTTGLDVDNAKAVLAAVEHLARNCTTFLITHDLRFTPRADLILYLDQGTIVEQGDHDHLVRLGGHYAALYNNQNVVEISRHSSHRTAMGRG